MTNEQIKQAYVISKAAKGVKRYHTLQKEAMQKQAGDGTSAWDTAKQIAGDYAMPTLVPAGIAGILGAIINGAQGKSMLKGLLGYGAAGAFGGAGYKALNDAGWLKFDQTPTAPKGNDSSKK